MWKFNGITTGKKIFFKLWVEFEDKRIIKKKIRQDNTCDCCRVAITAQPPEVRGHQCLCVCFWCICLFHGIREGRKTRWVLESTHNPCTPSIKTKAAGRVCCMLLLTTPSSSSYSSLFVLFFLCLIFWACFPVLISSGFDRGACGLTELCFVSVPVCVCVCGHCADVSAPMLV